MIVVADASPLIFLAKAGQLELIRQLWGGEIHISRLVHDEVIHPGVLGDERARLEKFLSGCHIHPPRKSGSRAKALSRADNDTVALALRLGAEVILADDRILRAVAEAEGIRPMGTLGVLLRSVRAGALSRRKAAGIVDDLIKRHGLRIDITVYRAVLAQLGSGSAER